MSSSSKKVIKAISDVEETWCVVGMREQPKANTPGPKTLSASEILAQAQAQAEAILAQAQAEAQEIIAAGQQKAAAIVVEAKRQGELEGRTTGYNEGLAQAVAEQQNAIEQIIGLAQSVENEQIRLLESSEAQLVELALNIATKVIGTELILNPARVTEVVARAIEEARSSGQHVISLCPEDASLIRQYLPQSAIEAGGNEWNIREDATLTRGDCLIETAQGTVDARIDIQLQEMTRLLRGDNYENHASS